MAAKNRGLPATGDDLEARFQDFREHLRMRDDSPARTNLMTLDDDAVEVAQGFSLMLGELPFHPLDIHH